MNDDLRQLIAEIRTLKERMAQLEAANLSLSAADMLAAVQTTGTWTPDLKFGGASTGITYSSRAGSYVKTGALCFIRCELNLTSKGSATGSATITGLPVTAAAGTISWLPVRWYTLGAAFVEVLAYPTASSTTLNLRGATAASVSVGTTLNNTHFDNATQLWVTGCYRV